MALVTGGNGFSKESKLHFGNTTPVTKLYINQ